jgi:urea transport system ATP-binding protein
MGVVAPYRGEILHAGRPLAGLPTDAIVRSGVALVPEGRRIFPELTVEENLRLGLVGRRSRDGAAEDLARVAALFPVVSEDAHRPAGVLSGGQQQQLAIARALAASPRLLILDEPTEGIQPSIIKDIGRVIRRLADEGLDGHPVAILLCEQYYDFAAELADEFLVLERGSVIARGSNANMQTPEIRGLVAI